MPGLWLTSMNGFFAWPLQTSTMKHWNTGPYNYFHPNLVFYWMARDKIELAYFSIKQAPSQAIDALKFGTSLNESKHVHRRGGGWWLWTGREEEVTPLPIGALLSELTEYHVNPHEKLNGLGISKATKRPNCPWREMTDVLFYSFK